MKTCVIVGQNMPDATSDALVAEHDQTWIFEPLWRAARACEYRYRDDAVYVFNIACGEREELRDFNSYNTDGLSSSLGTITKQARTVYPNVNLTIESTRKVHVVNLQEFLKEIDNITTLKIDAQGMDLTILKTMAPMLERSAIEFIQCEADGDGVRMYDGLPSNSVEDFMTFMANYPQYKFSLVPDRNTWNPDLQWTL